MFPERRHERIIAASRSLIATSIQVTCSLHINSTSLSSPNMLVVNFQHVV